jgi:2-methylisocitrate lyase-like PEP mutase family enzyme
MALNERLARAACFRSLNEEGRLLLPNAWDSASARIFEQAGFPAIGTTSGGIATARGFQDGERIGRHPMILEIAAIVRAVRVPVNADIEAGYGDSPGAVAEMVDAVLDAGAAGVNLEDRQHRSGGTALYDIAAQSARIQAARHAADRQHVPLVINARTDTFLLGVGSDLNDRVAETIERGRTYLQAGADVVFVPGLIDVEIVKRVARTIGGPISLMALPGAPPANALFDAGASRVSLGNVAMLATLGALRGMAADIRRTHMWTSLERTFLGFAEADALFAPR